MALLVVSAPMVAMHYQEKKDVRDAIILAAYEKINNQNNIQVNQDNIENIVDLTLEMEQKRLDNNEKYFRKINNDNDKRVCFFAAGMACCILFASVFLGVPIAVIVGMSKNNSTGTF